MQLTPFYLMIAPGREIDSGFIEDNTLAFYRDLFDDLDLLKAFNNNLASRMSLYQSEKFFAIVQGRSPGFAGVAVAV
jgi:hypothetical protein